MNNEFLHMQKLAGIITEGQYKAKLNEITVGEFPQYLVNSLKDYLVQLLTQPEQNCYCYHYRH